MALTDDILAYWNLNDNGSSGVSLVDDTGNGNTLTNNNGVTLGTGIIAGDAVFNPSLSNSLTTPITIGSDFSISAWVNITAFDGGVSVTGSSNDANAPSIVAASNVTYFFYGNNGGDCNSSINAPPLTIGTWHNIVGTISSSTSICRWYLDSVLISQDTFTGLGNFTEIQIGAYLARSIGTFNGQVDEVGVWNRALSPNEVYNLYYNGTGNTYPFTKPVIERPLTDDILAYWNLNNDGSGGVSLVDDTGNGYILTNNNDATLGTGIIGGDAVFNGVNQFLNNPTFPAFGTGNFSISLWVNLNPSGAAYYEAFISTRFDGAATSNAFSLGCGSDNVFTFYDGNQPSFGYTFSYATWYNIIITNFSGNLSFYFNGSLIGTTTQSFPYTNSFLSIGGHQNGAEPLNGSIDEVGVWNRALSPEDVTRLYNGGFGSTYPFGQTPTTTLFYNNAENDGDWGNLLNWWLDSGFTTQATALPTSTNPINLYNEVTQNTFGDGTCYCSSASFWSADFAAGLDLVSTGVVNMQGSSVMGGHTTDGVSMHDSSTLTIDSVIDGDVTMRDSSRAFGYIGGNAYVHYDGGNGQFPIGGIVVGSVAYIGWPAISPQWFNDTASGGASDGDFANMANWWSDDTYTTRPINSVGYQELPDPSTDVFIAPYRGFYANTGTLNPTVNSITTNNGYIQNISITVSNGAFFSGDDYYGIYEATIYGNVTFSGTAYNERSVIIGNADYKSAISLVESFNYNSLQRLTSGGAYGSNTMTVNIDGGGSNNFISRLLNLPWFINI